MLTVTVFDAVAIHYGFMRNGSLAIPTDTTQLRERAARIYRLRRLRSRYLDLPLGEPAWDMLLDLYCSHDRSRPVSTKSVSLASGAPLTTALRYLDMLAERGLVERSDDPNDGRRTFISLSVKGVVAMEAYLEGLGPGDDLPSVAAEYDVDKLARRIAEETLRALSGGSENPK